MKMNWLNSLRKLEGFSVSRIARAMTNKPTLMSHMIKCLGHFELVNVGVQTIEFSAISVMDVLLPSVQTLSREKREEE
ncbi:hypothetical protein DVH24_018850 [Malus domestica]|uniref:Uncharacterized protein n=1 Tax=Malus domestica TaxID=3750 RepID=A0A498HPL7_MALDO|nr:hypothetical protein DVH24_018850 [Malus domestica]